MPSLVTRPDAADVEPREEVLVILLRYGLEVPVRREEFKLSVLRLAAPALAQRVPEH